MSIFKPHRTLVLVLCVLAVGIAVSGCGNDDEPGVVGLYPPQDVTAADVGAGEILIQWTAPEKAPGGTVYRIARDGAALVTVDGTQYTDRNLQPTTSYTYTVRTVDALGSVSEPSSPVTATTRQLADPTPPSVPDGLAAEAQGSTSVSLSWIASTDNVGVVGYRVYRDGAEIAVVEHPKHVYVDSKVSAGTTYAYTVLAYDHTGNASALSAAVSVTTRERDAAAPSTPASLAASVSAQQAVDLTWSASTDNVGVTWYVIYRDGVHVGAAPGTEHGYTDTKNLVPSTQYTYTLTALDAAGNESKHSNQVKAITLPAPDILPPSVPGSVTATASGQSTIDLAWTQSTDNDRVTWYRIYRDGVMVGTTGKTNYRSQGLEPSTQYTYTVTALDFAGNESAHSAPVKATTLQAPDTVAPTAPSALTANASGQTTIDLAWGASTDQFGVTWYRIYRDGALVGTTGKTNYRSHGLSPATPYAFTVTAIDFAGNESVHSNLASATTFPAPDTTPPSAPTSLTATASGQNTIDLTWGKSTDANGVIWYMVYRDGKLVGTTGRTDYRSSGLDPATLYTFTVTAVDPSENESAPSNQASATTFQAPDVTPPTAPSSLSAVASVPGAIDLAWGASTDANGVTWYLIYRNGVLVGTTGKTNYRSHGLAAATEYAFTVTAIDFAGNESDPSNEVSATTLD